MELNLLEEKVKENNGERLDDREQSRAGGESETKRREILRDMMTMMI